MWLIVFGDIKGADSSNFAMGTILGKDFTQAQVQTNHSTSADGKVAFSNSNINKENVIKSQIASFMSIITLFICTWFLKNQVEKKFDKLDF